MAEAALPHIRVTANSRVGSAQADAEVQIPRKDIANGRGVGRPQSAETNDGTQIFSFPPQLTLSSNSFIADTHCQQVQLALGAIPASSFRHSGAAKQIMHSGNLPV